MSRSATRSKRSRALANRLSLPLPCPALSDPTLRNRSRRRPSESWHPLSGSKSRRPTTQAPSYKIVPGRGGRVVRVYARPAAPPAAKAAALRRVIGIDAPGLVVPRRRLSAATAQTTARRHKRPHKRPHTRLHTRPHKRVDKRVHQGPHSVCRALDSSPGAASRRRPEVSFIYSFPKFMVRRRLQTPPRGLVSRRRLDAVACFAAF